MQNKVMPAGALHIKVNFPRLPPCQGATAYVSLWDREGGKAAVLLLGVHFQFCKKKKSSSHYMIKLEAPFFR